MWQERTIQLLGEKAVEKLAHSRVLIAGAGGVGGYAAEMLTRSGVGAVTIIDADTVAESNINRQLIADTKSIGQPKTELWQKRLTAINPHCKTDCRQIFISPDNVSQILEGQYDFVADCIDTIAPKVALLRECVKRHIPVISSMGAGGRLDPSSIRYGSLWETREDGLARAVRQAFKRIGERPDIRVVWSSEAPHKAALVELEGEKNKRSSFGTLASIPAIFGLYMANYIVLHLSGIKTKNL